jgi:hypothetical protein
VGGGVRERQQSYQKAERECVRAPQWGKHKKSPLQRIGFSRRLVAASNHTLSGGPLGLAFV